MPGWRTSLVARASLKNRCDRLLVARELGQHHLDGGATADRDVLGLVHDAHPALAEDLEQPVVADCLSDHRVTHSEHARVVKPVTVVADWQV